jgi:hypothetical protein
VLRCWLLSIKLKGLPQQFGECNIAQLVRFELVLGVSAMQVSCTASSCAVSYYWVQLMHCCAQLQFLLY